MFRRTQLGVSLAIPILVAAGWNLSPAAGQEGNFARQIFARARVFPEIGPGVAALKRDSAGRYYVLAAPAKAVVVYGADGARIGQIPNTNSRGAKIVYAQDIDLDAQGRLIIVDRGANALKIFEPDGSLEATIPVTAPTSLAALSGDEFAVAALRSEDLVSIFDLHGKLLRGFGELEGAPAGAGKSGLLGRGRLYGDSTGHIYFAFTDRPDPTIRKYDRFGYASYEISLPSSEFTPQAEARRWNSITIEGAGAAATTKPVIRAVGIDPETHEVWAAIGDELVHFDRDGNRRAAYLTSTKEGAPIAASAILIEHDRMLIAADPLGVFDFALPERQLPPPSRQ